MMSEAELRELGADIVKNGLTSAIVLWQADSQAPLLLLDGRNRLAGVELETGTQAEITGVDVQVGAEFVYRNKVITLDASTDPYTFVISANIRRRHLTVEQKLGLVADVLKAQPQKTDRQIAKQTKVSPTTVGRVRRSLEREGDVSTVDTRIDTLGRKQPATKPSARKGGSGRKVTATAAPETSKPEPAASLEIAQAEPVGNGGDPGETAKAMAARHAAAETGNDDPEVAAVKSAVALLAALNRKRSLKMCHGFKEYETEPAEKFVTAISPSDLDNACDFLIGISEAADNAERKAKKAKRVAIEARHPEKARNKAREEAIRAAMEDDLEEARREAKESGERWGDVKDDWVAEWKEDHWGDEQEAEFNEEFRKNWQSDHGAPFPGAAAVNPPKQREAGAQPKRAAGNSSTPEPAREAAAIPEPV
jgi:hypothetical protein